MKHWLEYYGGLTMVIGTLLFWSTALPNTSPSELAKCSKLLRRTLGKIKKASEFYLNFSENIE
ncbi:hypothetical protein H4219_006317, partial [Mycoemilia scoparia]